MSKNNIDKHIAEKLKNREFSPSASAWERLSTQLDEQETTQKKKGWYVYVGYAASIVLLLSIAYMQFEKPKPTEPIKEIIVQKPIKIDSENVLPVQKKVFTEEVPVEKSMAVVEKNIKKVKTKKTKNKLFKKFETPEKELLTILKEETKVANTEGVKKKKNKLKEEFKIPEIKKDTSAKIKVNAADLLYAVTHTKEEVKNYYASKSINRKELLQTVEKQLKASKLKIDPETILAEVEDEIYMADEERESFMNKFKTKLSKVIVAIADRNK